MSRSSSTSGVITPQILGDDRLGPKCRGGGVEQPAARAGHPAAVLRRGLGRRDLPVGGEPTEVIDPKHVHEREGVPQPGNPPGVALGLVEIPPIEWIAPALACLGEVIRGHSRHDGRPAAGIQGEQLGPAPDIGAVVGHEDRQITNDRDPELGCPFPQPLPLLVK